MKLIKNRLGNRLTELSLTHLMNYHESPEKLIDSDLEEIVECGIEKVDGLLCKLSLRLTAHALCQALINTNMNFNNTIPRWGGGGGGGGDSRPPAPPPPNETQMMVMKVLPDANSDLLMESALTA